MQKQVGGGQSRSQAPLDVNSQSISRYIIIANPAAGRRRGNRLTQDVFELLRSGPGGIRAEVRCTERPGQAESLARAAVAELDPTERKNACVVAAGGDGTVQDVVNGLMAAVAAGGRVTLGLLPSGRCNDFASAFGIRRDARQIADVLLRGRARPVDLGRVNNRYFCTVAAFGFDATVSRFVQEMWMPLRGTPAYIYGVLRMLRAYRPPQVHMRFDETNREGPLFLAASANTSCYGGRMHIAPDARPDDAHLDICVVAPMPRLRVIRLLHRVLKGAHVSLPEVSIVRTRAVRIDSEPVQEIWADGERVAHTPATIEIVPNAIELLTA